LNAFAFSNEERVSEFLKISKQNNFNSSENVQNKISDFTLNNKNETEEQSTTNNFDFSTNEESTRKITPSLRQQKPKTRFQPTHNINPTPRKMFWGVVHDMLMQTHARAGRGGFTFFSEC